MYVYCEIVIWHLNLVVVEFDELRREPDVEIGKANMLGLCREYLGSDLGDAKSKSIVGWDWLLMLCCC